MMSEAGGGEGGGADHRPAGLSPHSQALAHTARSPRILHSLLGFQVGTEMYLTRWEDRAYFI